MDRGAPHVGFTCGAFTSVRLQVLRHSAKPPRVEPTRGAPAFIGIRGGRAGRQVADESGLYVEPARKRYTLATAGAIKFGVRSLPMDFAEAHLITDGGLRIRKAEENGE